MSAKNSELTNFAAFLTKEVNDSLNQSGEGGFKEAAFTQLAMEYMADADETGNVQVCTAVHRNKTGNRLRQINGYGLWDNYETLDLFIADFKGDGQNYTLDKSRAASAINLALRYLDLLLKGTFEDIEDSATEREFRQNFAIFKENILRIRLILLTDGVVKKEIKIQKTQIEEFAVISEIWDLERIYQLWSSQRKREPIEINLQEQFGHKIPCLSVEQPMDHYTTYLGIVPASLLADLYDVYGSRLLEQNVRVYLQNLGKVNKDIRKTILERPGMFMAYNNGISATATAVKMADKEQSGHSVINYIKDLQIVNGGQTTSSIYYARKKDRADLTQIHVQMKITLVHDDKQMENVVSRISKYANSQNKVSETDLTSNQTFHIVLEELSRTTWASPMSGHQQTRWYYERVKGQYKEELNKEHTDARKKNFKLRNPSDQVIRKEEFAKFRHAWHQLPHLVARGSQKNYLLFIDGEGKTEPARDYFHETVGIAILFKEGERLYGKKPNAMGDLRYLVVPYSLAWLNYYTDDRLDLEELWKRQVIPKELSTLLKDILFKVNDFFQKNKPETYALIGEWAKREDCWQALKVFSPEKWEIDLSPIKHLLIKGHKQEQSSVGNSPVLSVALEDWEAIELFGKETGKLTPIQTGIVRTILGKLRKKKLLTMQLVTAGEEILDIYASFKRKK
jgi:hypothetical protein